MEHPAFSRILPYCSAPPFTHALSIALHQQHYRRSWRCSKEPDRPRAMGRHEALPPRLAPQTPILHLYPGSSPSMLPRGQARAFHMRDFDHSYHSSCVTTTGICGIFGFGQAATNFKQNTGMLDRQALPRACVLTCAEDMEQGQHLESFHLS